MPSSVGNYPTACESAEHSRAGWDPRRPRGARRARGCRLDPREQHRRRRRDRPAAPTDTGLVDTTPQRATPTQPPPEERTRTIEVGGFPNAVAVGEKGVWILRDGRRVLRLDPATAEVVGRVGAGDELGSERGCGIAVGGGAVWVTTISGQVARLNPETNRVARLIAVEDAACIAAGARGIWVTSPNLGSRHANRSGDERGRGRDPGRRLPGGNRRPGSAPSGSRTPIPPKARPARCRESTRRRTRLRSRSTSRTGRNIVATGAGSIWASSNNGTIVRIDPKANELDGRPIAIAEAGAHERDRRRRSGVGNRDPE